MRTATGVNANAAPATTPATDPSWRRTAKYSSTTDATPASAWGSRTANGLNPSSRTDRPIAHSDTGGLSVVMNDAASSEPKNHAETLWPAACAAAE